MTAELANLSLTDLSDAIKRQDITAVEVTENALSRLHKLQADLNCVLHLEAEKAIEDAKMIDERLGNGDEVGKLAGVPLAHKDMYYREGRVSTCGSKIRRKWKADRTATVLKRLDAAGAVDLGGLNMAEFAVGPTGHNWHHGHCRNPWDVEHITGGSSSGSGSAVAARIVYGAMGSDTGGSVRIPSAMCGVVGLKPTQTRVSRYGMMPLSFSYDCPGPLTKTVRDAARILDIIAGADHNDPTSTNRHTDNYESACGQEVNSLRVAIPKTYYFEGLEPAVANAIEDAKCELSRLGIRFVEVDMPDQDEINAIWTISQSAEAATIHKQWLRESPQDYAPQVRRRIEIGLYQPATRYLESLSMRSKFLENFCKNVFAEADVMFAPTCPMAAPKIDETDIGVGDDMPDLIIGLSRCTRPISYLGLPSLSVPCGFSKVGLPTAFQLVGPPFAEALLCRIGDAYQKVTEWHNQIPDIAQFD